MAVNKIEEVNFEIKKYLQDIVNDLNEAQENLNNFGLIKTEETNDKNKSSVDFYEKSTVMELDYSISETFFTQNFEKKVKSIIKDLLHFKTLTRYEKSKVQEQLDSLWKNEYEWKFYNKRSSQANSSEIIRWLKEEFVLFSEQFDVYKNPSEEQLSLTQRSYRNYLLFKLKTFVKGILPVLISDKKLKVLKPFLSLNDEDFKKICSEYIEAEDIFTDLVKITVKEAHDNLFMASHKLERTKNFLSSDIGLVVLKTSLHSKYMITLALSFLNGVLNYAISKNQLKEDVAIELTTYISRFLIYKQHKFLLVDLKKSNWWGIHADNALVIIEYFIKSGFFEDIVKEHKVNPLSKKHLSLIKLVLPKKIETQALHFTKLPSIILPKKITRDSFEDYLKPVVQGYGEVSNSTSLQQTLNIAQSKKFRISPIFLKIAEDMFSLNIKTTIGKSLIENNVNFCFPTSHEIAGLQDEIFSLDNSKCSTNALQFYVANSGKNQLLGQKGLNLSYKTFLDNTNLTNIEKSLYFEKVRLSEKLESLHFERKYAKTVIEIAKWFLDYPIYITNEMCIRLRLYPREHWVSRVSGGIKHLLCDYTPRKVTLSGLANLFRAYYVSNQDLTAKFEDFLVKNLVLEKKSFNLMFEFFDQNSIDFTKTGDQILYFMYIHAEILQIRKSGRSGINIEIDQRASAVVFLSYILRSKKMAQVSNVLNDKSTPNCPYTHMMLAFPKFYENTMKKRSKLAYSFLSENKKLHKYAMMCYSYGQTHQGRIDDFIKRWNDHYKFQPFPDDYSVLFEFATLYEEFIDSVFPNTSKKLKILSEVVELCVKETSKMTVRTLEGEIIEYKFFRQKETKRAHSDPLTGVTKSYSFKQHDTEFNEKLERFELKDDIQNHKRKFLSYLIHSIDGAIMRRFIKLMKERHGYVINHLHDCVIIHPNYVDNFYDLVTEIYNSTELYNMIESLVFDHVRSRLTPESQKRLDDLKKEYFSLCDDFKDDIGKQFNPRHVYKFED